MASTSSSHQQNAFSGIEPPNKRRKIEESSRVYDVFINHRGPEVKQTLAIQLYNLLKEVDIKAFLDSEEKEHGVSFISTIESAIRSASVHIAIFSPKYAESDWCLRELVLMSQSNAKIIPVFYQVEPWELRFIEKGVYAEAFRQYEEKGRYRDKLEEWKEALNQVSYTAGDVFKESDSFDCKGIVSAVEKEVQSSKRLHVAKYPVGLHNLVTEFERRCLGDLVQDFESQCIMKKGAKGKANVVGIFGMGGIGKTTLSKELFNQKRSKYTRASFLFDVREACVTGKLPSLQSKLLKDIFGEDQIFQSSEEGTSCLRDRLERSSSLSFLIVLDDIDHVKQLDDLLVIDILIKSVNNLVIITTKNVGVLVSAGIDTGYHLKGLNREDGRELFCWHAFDQPLPLGGYEDLVQHFVKVCGGLPLSLVVLGRHLSHRPQWYWQDELEKVKETLPGDIKQRLKMSIDTLDNVEKQIFMDVACFFIGKSITKAMLIWKVSGWRARRALQILKEKCLVEEIKEVYLNMLEYKWESTVEGSALRMHDHLRDLGREMADELSYPHRVWRPQDLKSLELKGFQNILTQTKSRCFHSIVDKSMGCGITYFLGEPENGSDASLLWLQLEYLSCCPLDLNSDINSSIPSWIPLQNLQCLRISNGCFKRLWQSDVQEPFNLEELQIHDTFVENFSNLLGKLNNMKKLVLNANDIQTDIWSSLEFLRMNLSNSRIVDSHLEGHLAYNVQKITLPTTLNELNVQSCRGFQRIAGITDLTELGRVLIKQCPELEELPSFGRVSNLVKIEIDSCDKLQKIMLPTTLSDLDVQSCRGLQRIAGIADLMELRQVFIKQCPELEELPSFGKESQLHTIEIDSCDKLQKITLPTTLISLQVARCRDLQRITGIADLKELDISECPKLDLACLSTPSCLGEIAIDSCENIQNISAIEELHVPEYVRLSYCSNAVIRNFIHKWKSAPVYTCVIGKAVDGAESSLNEPLFSDANIGVDGVIQICADQVPPDWSEWCAEVNVVCLVVVIDSSTLAEDINKSIASYGGGHYPYKMRQGKSIITIVGRGFLYRRVMWRCSDIIKFNGRILKKGVRIGLKEGGEWESLGVLRTIVDRLYEYDHK
ncbi:hypothetical protein SUGI_0670650 [Cryptomeria japonica]|nr:hypothetical protein SUGI_0670650 [Cryptomeria japonica]